MKQNLEDIQRAIDLTMADHEHLYCVFSSVRDHFVVTDSNNDQFYSVGSNKYGEALVHTGYRPFLFKDVQSAVRCAERFHAKNGNGPIEWKVMSAAEYYELMQPRLESLLKNFNMLKAIYEKESLEG